MDDGIVTWLHLSDFHVGKDDYATRKMFDYILTHVRQQKEKGIVPDILFITGDVAQDAKSHQYEMFWLEFITPLHDEIGGGIEQRTFVVPGNHDVDRSKNPAFSQDEIAKPESRYLDPTEEGGRLRDEMLMSRFRQFVDNDCTLAKGGFESANGAFAQCLTVNGVEVGVVGLNTAWLSKDDKDERRLTPGKSLLEFALNSIQSARLRIVLGHHPIDWFIPAQQKPIKSLLGNSCVLYLHGHLHDAWAEPNYGGGNQFLAIQSGAGFQAREGERWRNGLLWGEARPDGDQLRLQAWRWVSEQQNWALATDALHESLREGEWWNYDLPSLKSPKFDYSPPVQAPRMPRGFLVFKSQDLSAHVKPLALAEAVRYFDGSVPDWSTALSTSIPRRGIVSQIVKDFHGDENSNRPKVFLLLAAACEGKTTALLQAAFLITEGRQDWRILQRRDDSQQFAADEILGALDEGYNWLFLLDEADRIAADFLRMLKSLPDELSGRVHAVLACRDTDWIASKADRLDWTAVAHFQRLNLRGLHQDDAQAIVDCWAAYGDAGLGELADTPQLVRAAVLVEQAKAEASSQSGAFFGALLTVRRGTGLREHARSLLERLGERSIPGGGDLRVALAYVAIMHAEGLEFLSRPVLAQALHCPLSRLHREVLIPLGQEAAATSTSSFVFTRHKRIADVLTSVLVEEIGEDTQALYIAMTTAAISLRSSVDFIPAIHEWRFGISDHFFEKGQVDLALNIAQAVLEQEPANPRTRTHVAKLFRRADLLEESVQVFRAITDAPTGYRGFYGEWGVCETEQGNASNSIVVKAFGLADQCPAPRIDNDQAKKILVGLGLTFGSLFDAHHLSIFRDARMAVAVLGLALHLDDNALDILGQDRTESANQGALEFSLAEAIPILHAGVAAAESVGVCEEITQRLPQVKDMTFTGLDNLAANSLKRKSM